MDGAPHQSLTTHASSSPLQQRSCTSHHKEYSLLQPTSAPRDTSLGRSQHRQPFVPRLPRGGEGKGEGGKEGRSKLGSEKHAYHLVSTSTKNHPTSSNQKQTCKKRKHTLPSLHRNTTSKRAPHPMSQNGRGRNTFIFRGCIRGFPCPPPPLQPLTWLIVFLL